jgi:phenylacetate-CoA ligase
MKVIFSNAELLRVNHRETLGKAFQCPVKDTYGMGEYAAGASECEEGAMHIWPEAGFIETMDDDEDIPVQGGTSGRIIATGLLNSDMPLIRYEVGDRAKLPETDTRCVCGRTLGLIDSFEGRMNDLIVTPDGRRVFWLNPVFYGLPVREAQIIQERADSINVLIVPAHGYTSNIGKTIIDRMHERVGDMEVTIESTGHIPRSANGKFQAVVSHVNRKQ